MKNLLNKMDVDMNDAKLLTEFTTLNGNSAIVEKFVKVDNDFYLHCYCSRYNSRFVLHFELEDRYGNYFWGYKGEENSYMEQIREACRQASQVESEPFITAVDSSYNDNFQQSWSKGEIEYDLSNMQIGDVKEYSPYNRSNCGRDMFIRTWQITKLKDGFSRQRCVCKSTDDPNPEFWDETFPIEYFNDNFEKLFEVSMKFED